MSQKAKPDFVVTDKATDGQTGAKEAEVREPLFKAEPSAAKSAPPEDAMVQQILERQAVFGF